MKFNRLVSGCLVGLLCLSACSTQTTEMKEYTGYVNPFIGTGGH